VWIGGTLSEVWTDRLVIHEPLGSVLTLRRLGQGATAFYHVSGERWDRLGARAQVGVGGSVCVESALDGTNLLALRVFLGASCGPTG
jgi:hypothetical protein